MSHEEENSLQWMTNLRFNTLGVSENHWKPIIYFQIGHYSASKVDGFTHNAKWRVWK